MPLAGCSWWIYRNALYICATLNIRSSSTLKSPLVLMVTLRRLRVRSSTFPFLPLLCYSPIFEHNEELFTPSSFMFSLEKSMKICWESLMMVVGPNPNLLIFCSIKACFRVLPFLHTLIPLHLLYHWII